MRGTSGAPVGLCPDGAKLSQSGLRLRSDMPFEAWLAYGRRLCEFTSASAWWLGDWLVYGQRTYGKRYEDALKAAPLSYQTLRNYAWVARRFPVSRRRDKLSFQHHAEVAALPEARGDLWLQRAERMRWSRNELRRRVALSAQSPAARKARAVTVRLELTADRRNHWRQAAEATDQSLVEWLVAVADAAAESRLSAQRLDQPAAVLREEPPVAPVSARQPHSRSPRAGASRGLRRAASSA